MTWDDDIEAAYQEQLQREKEGIDQAEYEYYASLWEHEQEQEKDIE